MTNPQGNIAASLALYKGRGSVGNALIRWWTRSPYSHCEIVVGNGLAYSSSIQDGGVRAKRIEFDPAHWDFINLPGVEIHRVLDFYARTAGQPFGWKDLLLRQVLNRRGDSDGWFCSEWCAAALGLPNPQTYSPATLADYCKSRLT